MPSPFPGVDPYIKAQKWEGFHTHFLVEVARTLVPQVRPRYVVETEERIYVEESGEPVGTIRRIWDLSRRGVGLRRTTPGWPRKPLHLS